MTTRTVGIVSLDDEEYDEVEFEEFVAEDFESAEDDEQDEWSF